MKKAVFLDRDGIINELVFYPEQGVIDSPMTSSQVNLVHGIEQLIAEVKEMGFITIVCSNQPGVALGKIALSNLKDITNQIETKLKSAGVTIDKFYYCMHHPHAKSEEYKIQCDCRKPQTGLFLQAAKEFDIDFSSSWMIGDGVDDIKAGYRAGCKTILLVNLNSAENLRIIEEQLGEIKPDFIVKKLTEVPEIIRKHSVK